MRSNLVELFGDIGACARRQQDPFILEHHNRIDSFTLIFVVQ